MKVGDKVKVINPLNGFDCDIRGVITAFYGSDRVIVKTHAGQQWALKKNQVSVMS